MAYANFSTALMHVGGQNVYYNVSFFLHFFNQNTLAYLFLRKPFTPPPSKLSKTLQWTPGSVYYPTLVISEAFGKSNASRVVDLTPLPEYDANSIYHPVYAIYENDVVARMVLFNFIDDSTRGSDLDVTINIQNQSPTQVQVRYLQADSVSEQYDIYWANQTLGQSFASDGRLYGDLETITITCDEGVCIVPVPAPSVALVYLSDAALEESSISEYATLTYPTSIIGSGSATVDVESLSTSNGKEGSGRGSTSKGGAKSSAGRRVEWMGGLLGLGLLLGAINI